MSSRKSPFDSVRSVIGQKRSRDEGPVDTIESYLERSGQSFTLEDLGELWPAEKELLQKCKFGNMFKAAPAFEAEWSEFEAFLDATGDEDTLYNAAEQMLGAPAEKPVDLNKLPPFAVSVLQWELHVARQQLGHDERWMPVTRDDWHSIRWARTCCRRELRRWRSVDVTNKAISLRAEFLRLLLTKGDLSLPAVPSLLIANAHIVGSLKLTGKIDISLGLFDCYVSGDIEIIDASLKTLNLGGTRVERLLGDRVEIAGRLFLRNGFRCEREIRLSGATISGGIEFFASTVAPVRGEGPSEESDCRLRLDSTMVGRDILFGERFFCVGSADLDGANISGDFYIRDSRIGSPKGMAISLIDATVSGATSIVGGSEIYGTVALSGSKLSRSVRFEGTFEVEEGGCIEAISAEIGSDFIITRSSQCFGDVTIDTATVRGDAVFLGEFYGSVVIRNTEVKRKLVLGSSGDSETYRFSGLVDCELSSASAFEFHSSWLTSKALFDLNNFKYETMACFDVENIEMAGARLLGSQYERQYFNPQPFEHLAGVMRRTGREDEARSFIRLKNKEQRRWSIRRNWHELKGHLTERPDVWKRLGFLNWMAYPAVALLAPVTAVLKYAFILLRALIFEKFLGSGFSRTPVVATYFLLLFLCGWVYEKAGEQAAIVPVNQMVLLDEDARRLCAGSREGADLQARINWTNCKAVVAGFNEFRPYWYSLDLMLQFGPLGQRRDWQPSQDSVLLPIPLTGEYEMSAAGVHTLVWMQSVLALGLYLLLAAMLTGIIKKE